MLETAGAINVAGECEQGGKKGIKRTVGSEGALTAIHFGVAVPKLAARFIGEVFVDNRDAGVPHVEAISVAEQTPAFPEVFIIGIDATANVAVGIGPNAGFDVDAGADKAEGRAAFEGIEKGALGFVVEDRITSEFT